MTGKTGLRRFAHPLEHLMDVDRLALDRAVVREGYYAISECDDPICLVTNQLRLGPSLGVGVLLQQLCRAADAGKRGLDLMGEHRLHRRYRAGGVPMG